MGFVDLISVSTTAATAIVANTACWRITVGEDPSVTGFPTTELKVMKPLAASDARRLLRSSMYTFNAESPIPFAPGQTVGFVKALDAATTCFQDEE